MNSGNKLKESEVRAFSKFTGGTKCGWVITKGETVGIRCYPITLLALGLLETSSLLSLYIPKVLPVSCKDVGQAEVGIEFLKRG